MKDVESKLEAFEEEIAEIDAENNFIKIKDNVNDLVDDTDNINCNKMWQLRKQIGATKSEPPTAKTNDNGELVTEPSKLKELYKPLIKPE